MKRERFWQICATLSHFYQKYKRRTDYDIFSIKIALIDCRALVNINVMRGLLQYWA